MNSQNGSSRVVGTFFGGAPPILALSFWMAAMYSSHFSPVRAYAHCNWKRRISSEIRSAGIPVILSSFGIESRDSSIPCHSWPGDANQECDVLLSYRSEWHDYSRLAYSQQSDSI